MAETLSKRQREETQNEDCGDEDHKRQKSYNHILSILDSEEEPTQDLSSLITTLQQEISFKNSGFDPLPSASSEIDPENVPATTSTSVEEYSCTSSSCSSSPSTVVKDEQEDYKENVMKHLLEASDDELGIPNRDLGVGGFDCGFDGDDGFIGGNRLCFSDGLWELEDEAANYYTLLQSELFM